MAQLRRKPNEWAPGPVAAEVLEVRSLLSGAAAAVHAAELHAAHVHKAATVPSFSFKGSIGGTLNVPAFSFTHDFLGTLSISKTTLQPGAKFKASLSVPFIEDLTVRGIKGSLSATINSNVPSGANKVITLTPTGGSLTGSLTFSGMTIKTTLLPKNVPFTLTIDSSNNIVSFAGTYVVPSIPGLTAGGDAAFSFSST